MKGRDLLLLLALAALWSSSFLFIKVALAELTPALIVLGRLAFGSLTLLASIPFLRKLAPDLLPEGGGRGILRGVLDLRRPLLFPGRPNSSVAERCCSAP